MVAQLDDLRFIFSINPEEEETAQPSRSAVVNTLAGAYLEMWGPGVRTYTVSGTTGYRVLHQGEGDGFQTYLALRNLHTTYQNKCATKDPNTVYLNLIIPPFATDTNQVVVGPAGPLASGSPPQPPSPPLQAGESGIAGAGGVYRVNSDNLQLFRNKASPLLFRYRWQFTILNDYLNPMLAPSARFQVNGAVQLTGGTNPAPSTDTTDLLPPLQTISFTVPTDGSITTVSQIKTSDGTLTSDQATQVITMNGLNAAGNVAPGQTVQIPQNFNITTSAGVGP
jgi:hypothetical protein